MIKVEYWKTFTEGISGSLTEFHARITVGKRFKTLTAEHLDVLMGQVQEVVNDELNQIA